MPLRTFIFLDHKWYKAYVIQRGGEMAGFCFATQLKNHASYDRTAELGVYLKPEYTRRGLGGEAVRHMEKAATADGLKMLIASICGENAASLKLFEKLGYDRCGHFKRIGEKWGRVLDVVFFQKSLEGG